MERSTQRVNVFRRLQRLLTGETSGSPCRVPRKPQLEVLEDRTPPATVSLVAVGGSLHGNTVQFTGAITGGGLPQGTTVEVVFATGPNPLQNQGQIVGAPLEVTTVPAGTGPGSKTFSLKLPPAPAGAKYVELIGDPNGTLTGVNESNNVAAVALSGGSAGQQHVGHLSHAHQGEGHQHHHHHHHR